MQCLNLKITYSCNNKCSYCFSAEMKDTELKIGELKKVMEKAYREGCRGIIISGGEPTIVPELLIEVFKYAFKLGFRKYILQTNGSGLAREGEILELVRDFSQKVDMAISFSILGGDAEEHDYITQNKGAFERLIRAMENIKSTNCKIYTNTVISSKNKNSIRKIIEIINKYNAEVIQLSVMHTEEENELAVGLVESVKVIENVRECISKEILRTEGIPYCLMKGYETCVGESYWPSILDLYNGNNDYKSNFSQIECKMRWKNEKCKGCILDSICQGVWYEQRDEFESMNINPIK